MPLLLCTSLEAFQELGVPQEIFTEKALLVQDQTGVLHGTGTLCVQGTNTTWITASIQDLTPATECSCLRDSRSGIGPTWDALSSLLEGLDLLQGPTETTPVGHFQHHAHVRSGRNFLHWTLQDVLVPVMCIPALEKLETQLEEHQATILACLRSQETREHYQELASGPDTGHLVAVGLPRADPFYYQQGITGAALLTYGPPVPREGAHVLVMPENVTHHLLQDDRDGPYYPHVGVPSLHRLTDADTLEVIEAARTLWEPHGTGPLQGLTTAFEAARMTAT